jgi:hypothetical protein
MEPITIALVSGLAGVIASFASKFAAGAVKSWIKQRRKPNVNVEVANQDLNVTVSGGATLKQIEEQIREALRTR